MTLWTSRLSSHLLAARGAGRPGDDHLQWQAGRDRHASGRPHVIHARPPRRAGQSRGQRRARDAHVPPERPAGQALSETSPAGTTSGTPTAGTQVGIPGSTLVGYRRSAALLPSSQTTPVKIPNVAVVSPFPRRGDQCRGELLMVGTPAGLMPRRPRSRSPPGRDRHGQRIPGRRGPGRRRRPWRRRNGCRHVGHQVL